MDDTIINFFHRLRKEIGTASFFHGISFKIIRFFLSKYIFLHNIQKILVNVKTKQVFVTINRKQEMILKRTGRLFRNHKYCIEKDTFKDIQHIINENNRKMFKNLKKKIELEKHASEKL